LKSRRGVYFATTLSLVAVLADLGFNPLRHPATTAQAPTWVVFETHELVRLLVAPGVSPSHVDEIRMGIGGFNTFARETLQKPLTRLARFHVFPNAESRLPVMRQLLNVPEERLRAILGIDLLSNPKGCTDCSRPDGTIWLRLDWDCLQQQPRPTFCSIAFVSAHALTHMWQFGHNSSGREPQWLQEGVADYVGYRTADVIGQIPWNQAIERMRAIVARSPVPIPRSLDAFGMNFESAQRLFYPWEVRSRGAGYSLFALLTNQLVEAQGIQALTAYYDALGSSPSWVDSFQRAFKVSPQDAYQTLLRSLP